MIENTHEDGEAGIGAAGPGGDGAPGALGGGAKPSPWLWLIYLFFRPRTFFPHFVVDASTGLTALCAWVYGMTGIIDQIETRTLMRPESVGFALANWRTYWAVVLGGGILGGLAYFAIGGWWYRVRLEWSGAKDVHKALARRVYLFAAQVLALPTLVATVSETMTYPTPKAAWDSEWTWWYMLLLLFPFWSAWVSYAGARAVFTLRRGLALLWFLILPSAFYLVVYGLIGVVGVFLALGPADLGHPLRHESAAMSFSYPGNWMIDTWHEEYDPESNLYVEPMLDAFMHILLYESDTTAEAELELTVSGFDDVMQDASESGHLDRWGSYAGTGRIRRGTIDGAPYELRVFVHVTADGMFLETVEFHATADAEHVLPGFALIRNTFVLR